MTDQNANKQEEKKGFFARLMDKLDKKVKDASEKKSCCCSSSGKKNSSC